MAFKKIKTLDELQTWRQNLDGKLAFVPTMGALHDGHLSLVKEGLKRASQVIVSIYVNPTQFAPHEDFDQYPRQIEDDIRKLKEVGAQTVWLPDTQDIYPNGPEITVHAGEIAKTLEGEFRPHFFDGVTTVVARLFECVKPDIAIFGEKDFQQLQVIRHMAETQKLPIEIIGAPIIRDENGLALSSRNAYLSVEEYKIAIQLNRIMKEMADGQIDEKQAHQKLLEADFDKIDYCCSRNSATLKPENPNHILAAVWLGKTRLIDNMPMLAVK
ncbi:MAG: pantoate--beta-alanine ligase [Alphaproteobacteria bacterium]|nr:pantoate--beta-alanine ligase [Alphaproteobacteria bacterium]